MNILYLYVIPVVWVMLGILYVRTLPKDGFSGVAEIFLTLVIGLVLFIAVVIYHMTTLRKKRNPPPNTPKLTQ